MQQLIGIPNGEQLFLFCFFLYLKKETPRILRPPMSAIKD